MLLSPIGEAGQAMLSASHACVVGCGALGTVAAELLARAGVGTLTLIDRDIVETTNLQRQLLFTEQDAAESLPKAEAARRRLGAINSTITLHAHIADCTSANAESLILGNRAPDVLIDALDNFETRYLLNDLAVKHRIPLVYGAAIGTGGMMMTIIPGITPCLRCLFPDAPTPGSAAAGATCDTVGVLGPLTTLIGSLQVAETIKLLTKHPESVHPGLRSIDLWSNESRTLNVSHARSEDCPCCGQGRFEFLERTTHGSAAALCGRDAVQISPADSHARIDLDSLALRLAPLGEVVKSPYMLRLIPLGESVELTVFPDSRAIIRGTNRPEQARAIYARYIGV